MTTGNAPLARAGLTGAIITHLTTTLGTGCLVGRGSAPPEGGWVKGQPGNGAFVNYTVLKTGNAVTPARGEPEGMGRGKVSWEVNYSLTTAGALESHVDDTADLVRAAIASLAGPFVLRDDTWSLQLLRVPRLGPTVPNNSVDPPFWEVTDDVSVWLSLERHP